MVGQKWQHIATDLCCYARMVIISASLSQLHFNDDLINSSNNERVSDWPWSEEAADTELDDGFDETQRQECEYEQKTIDTLKEPVHYELYNNTSDHWLFLKYYYDDHTLTWYWFHWSSHKYADQPCTC